VKFLPTDLPEVVLIEPDVHRDARGFFLEAWHAGKYGEGGIPARFVQDNHSKSGRGTLRGFHAQARHPQGKLVRVLRGEIFDVAVDIRVGSPSFARHVCVRLTAESFRQVWVPQGFGHGFLVLSEEAEVEYKCTDFYDPGDEIGFAWNDPVVAVRWPIDDPILSEKDRNASTLAAIEHLLPRFEGTGR
jgi:dTDP-4-dehydrorhamnose 3,5-epimerase